MANSMLQELTSVVQEQKEGRAQHSQPMEKDARSVKSLEEVLRTATPKELFLTCPEARSQALAVPSPGAALFPPPLWPPSCQAALATPTPA